MVKLGSHHFLKLKRDEIRVLQYNLSNSNIII
jgi:hypothetical protein